MNIDEAELGKIHRRALKILRYFERMVAENGDLWEPGRVLASRFVETTEAAEKLSLDELDDIHTDLLEGIDDEGTAWYELYLEVKMLRRDFDEVGP